MLYSHPWAWGYQLHCPALRYAALPRIALHCTALPCPALPYPAVHCTVLRCTALPATPHPTLQCPALPCPALPCPAPQCPALPCPTLLCLAVPRSMTPWRGVQGAWSAPQRRTWGGARGNNLLGLGRVGHSFGHTGGRESSMCTFTWAELQKQPCPVQINVVSVVQAAVLPHAPSLYRVPSELTWAANHLVLL